MNLESELKKSIENHLKICQVCGTMTEDIIGNTYPSECNIYESLVNDLNRL